MIYMIQMKLLNPLFKIGAIIFIVIEPIFIIKWYYEGSNLVYYHAPITSIILSFIYIYCVIHDNV